MISKELKEAMVSLRLSGVLLTLDERIEYAMDKKLSIVEFLEVIFYDELERRQAKLLNLKMKKAGVDSSLGSFDFDTKTAYDRDLVKRLMMLSFIEKHSSVLIFGPTGVGKEILSNVVDLRFYISSKYSLCSHLLSKFSVNKLFVFKHQKYQLMAL